jgi:hypothetical protein
VRDPPLPFHNDLAEPLLNHGIVDVVVVDPAFVTVLYGGVDADDLHLPSILGEVGFEGLQVVAVYDEVIFRRFGIAEGIFGLEGADGTSRWCLQLSLCRSSQRGHAGSLMLIFRLKR